MVLSYMVRSTNIIYENKMISFPFAHPSDISLFSFPLSSYNRCKNIFGLTKDEMDYVWGKYKKNILDKIEDGE